MLDFGYASTNGAGPDLSVLMNAPALAFDTETTGVSTPLDSAYGFSLAPNSTCAYFAWVHDRFFTDLLADTGYADMDVLKIAHNAKFDRSMLKKAHVVANKFFDTMVAAHLLEEANLDLHSLLRRCVPHCSLDHRTYSEYQRPIAHSTLQELALHFGSHSVGAYMLYEKFQRDLRAGGLEDVFWNVEMPLIPVLSDMELNGAMIDTQALEELGVYYDERIQAFDEALEFYANQYGVHHTNFNSADQVAYLMYEKVRVPKPPSYTYKGKKRPSVDKTHLTMYKNRYPIVSVYLQYKAFKHLKDTYVTGILKRLVGGRIHTNFNQTRTRTGRLSSSDPNLQNIPMRSQEGKKIRTAFVAPEGSVIMKADYTQMELKKMACLANCKAMLQAFIEGRDIHEETAIRVYGDAKRRPEGKTKNFQLIYGGGSEEDQEMLFNAYPEIRDWMKREHKRMEMLGYARTHYGRREHLGNFDSMNAKAREHAFRQGGSLMDQGSCSEYTKLGMRKVWDAIHDTDVKMLLQVHDELVFEVPHERVRDMYFLLHDCMTYNELQIPLTIDVSVGPNWAEQVEFTLERKVTKELMGTCAN